MDPLTAVTTATVSFLVPYFQKTGETLAQKLGEQLYTLLSDRVHKPGAREALHDLAQKPANHDLQAALRVQLTKLVQEDPALGSAIQECLDQAPQPSLPGITIHQQAGDQAFQIGQVTGNVAVDRSAREDLP